MDFEETLQGDIFTFHVGQAHQPFKVHASMFPKYSKPFEAMMCNNLMRESSSGTAVLEEVEPSTFVQFAEFCYSGNYQCSSKRPSSRAESSDLANRLISAGLLHYYCHTCGEGYLPVSASSHFPTCSSTCTSDTTWCILCRSRRSNQSADERICKICAARYPSVVRYKPHQRLWEDFKEEEFTAPKTFHRNLMGYLHFQKIDEPSDDLIDHARLWVFAECYDIPTLRQLCLHKLHRDLVAFKLSQRNMDKFLDLWEYIADNTTETPCVVGVSAPSERTPRQLLMRYAACHSEILREDKDFGELLENGGSLVKDYVQTLMQCYFDSTTQKSALRSHKMIY